MLERMLTILRQLGGGRNRSGLTHAGREYLSRARADASSRVLRSRRLRTRNQYQYPSAKMSAYIPYESRVLEADLIHLYELSPKVEEYYSQGPRFEYRYRGSKGKLIWTSTIPDFVVVETNRVVLVEIKT